MHMKIVFWVKFHTRKDKQTVQHSKGKKKYRQNITSEIG